MPLRGQKGDLYDGGIRVPAILEWPARVRRPVVSDAIAVTSDFLPTLCQLAGRPLPDRPLDGISLVPLIEERMKERPRPIFFWSFSPGRLVQKNPEPYIPPPLQEGTTPLVKAMDGRFTRNFRNVRYPEIVEQDKVGPRAVVDNRYKLVIDGQRRGGPSRELFDMRTEYSSLSRTRHGSLCDFIHEFLDLHREYFRRECALMIVFAHHDQSGVRHQVDELIGGINAERILMLAVDHQGRYLDGSEVICR